MKRIIILATCIILVISLAACGQKAGGNESVAAAETTATEIVAETETVTQEETTVETIEETTTETTAETTTEPETLAEGFEIYENEYFSVQIPAGWSCESAGSALGMVIIVYDPEDATKQVIYCDEIQGVSNSEDAEKVEESMGVTVARFASMRELVDQAGEYTFGYTDYSQEKTTARGTNETVTGTIKYDDVTLKCMATAKILVLSGAQVGDFEVEMTFAESYQMITALPEDFDTVKPQLLHVLDTLDFTDRFWSERQEDWTEMVGGVDMSTTRDSNIIGIMQ